MLAIIQFSFWLILRRAYETISGSSWSFRICLSIFSRIFIMNDWLSKVIWNKAWNNEEKQRENFQYFFCFLGVEKILFLWICWKKVFFFAHQGRVILSFPWKVFFLYFRKFYQKIRQFQSLIHQVFSLNLIWFKNFSDSAPLLQLLWPKSSSWHPNYQSLIKNFCRWIWWIYEHWTWCLFHISNR